MSDTPAQDTVSLDALRRDIDAADEEMHRQLIHRGEVIERLIDAKRLSANGGAAFRPDREAAMMRRIAARHTGSLPLSTVEHIWREIIGTFTQLQAPYRVLAARAADPAMRDLLRYYFGFSSPLVGAASNREAIDTVARTGTDLAVVALDDPLEERWWESLTPSADAPGFGAKVIAYLPFLPLQSGLDLPRAVVIGPKNVEAPDDLHLYAVDLADTGSIDGLGTILARSAAAALIAAPRDPAGFGKTTTLQSHWLGCFAKPTDWT
ncbi:chorismate mutase [Microbaculum marinisediminis]|uniref:chorismate mutase n=1 Tax=Microbaculum marinisediminis TaxID=2931392 RepID=A0AAW5QXG1_9HYPH|nr:chorismate mutase [Microbaculum sp. A6E488]MCT8972393.1 chorismate mutase [Microbaculum sp. A6E488]